MKPEKLKLIYFLSDYARSFRKSRKLTQEQMSERLRISPRAYSELERKQCCFSALTLIKLLLMMEQNELLSFVEDLRKLFRA